MITFIKIKNFYNIFGQPDWKGLSLDSESGIVPASQIYRGDEVILATRQNPVPQHQDLIEITQDDYTMYRHKPKQEQLILQEQIDLIKIALDDIILNGGAL